MVVTDFLKDRIVLVKVLLLLVVITDINLGAFPDGSRIGRHQSADDLKHCRFTGSIFP